MTGAAAATSGVPVASPPSRRAHATSIQTSLKARACARIDALADLLLDISHRIHEDPELAFREIRASSLLAETASRFGMRTTRPAHGLPTAFRAESGSRGPLVVICCEYDALPGLGHGCGHNIVAAVGLGAALALADPALHGAGRITLLGTPAEEGGGGKIVLLRRGAFLNAAAVLLAHPGQVDSANARFRAAQRLEVSFRGRAAHAAMAPGAGRNALDAAVSAYQALAATRAGLNFGEHISAVLSGGRSANVVPDLATLSVMVRAPHASSLQNLAKRVDLAAQSGATASLCSYVMQTHGPTYAGFTADPRLVRICEANMRCIGRTPLEVPERDLHRAGSTDLGNVSQVVPSAHPKLAITSASQHSAAFARAARSETGDRAVLDGAKLLALTAIDIWGTTEGG